MSEITLPRITCAGCKQSFKINLHAPVGPLPPLEVEAPPKPFRLVEQEEGQLINCPNCKGPLLKVRNRRVES